jgi:hypothetical protein
MRDDLRLSKNPLRTIPLSFLRSSHCPASPRTSTINGVGRRLPPHHHLPKAGRLSGLFCVQKTPTVTGICAHPAALPADPRFRPCLVPDLSLFSVWLEGAFEARSSNFNGLGVVRWSWRLPREGDRERKPNDQRWRSKAVVRPLLSGRHRLIRRQCYDPAATCKPLLRPLRSEWPRQTLSSPRKRWKCSCG